MPARTPSRHNTVRPGIAHIQTDCHSQLSKDTGPISTHGSRFHSLFQCIPLFSPRLLIINPLPHILVPLIQAFQTTSTNPSLSNPPLIHTRQALQHARHLRRHAPHPHIVQHRRPILRHRCGQRSPTTLIVRLLGHLLEAVEDLHFFRGRRGAGGLEGVEGFGYQEDCRALGCVSMYREEGKEERHQVHQISL